MKSVNGLGDVVEQITTITGVKALVHKLFGENCKCEERKAKLNTLFPFKVSDLTEDEFLFLHEFNWNQEILNNLHQQELLRIFNRVFNQKNPPTSCAACWRNIIDNLHRLYNEYINEVDIRKSEYVNENN